MGMLNKVVELSIGLFIAGVMIPIGLQAIATANITGVDATVATVFTLLLPILAILGLVLYFVPRLRGGD
jgi:hypothetical protein